MSKRISAVEVAEKYNLNLKELSSKINMIHILADCIEMYLISLDYEFKKIGTNIPAFKTDVKILTTQARGLVKKVNKYCDDEATENFGKDCDTILEILEKFRKDEKD